jgi:hypothetical protein
MKTIALDDKVLLLLNTKVERIESSGCWIFLGAKTKQGYGHFTWQYKQHYLHREVYRIYNHPYIVGYVIRHSCDNPSCVNPEHLELGSQRDNVRDSIKRGTHVSTSGG